MQLELVVAIIGACSTIIVGLIGAYVTLKTQPASPGVQATPVSPAKRRKTYAVVALAVALAGVVVVLGYLSANQVDRQLRSYRKLVTAGLAKNKPYVIPGILMLIQLEKGSDGKTLDSTRHIFYELHTLQETHRDKPGFDEEYHTKLGIIDRIPGADKEVQNAKNENLDSEKSWDVYFDSAPGDRRIVLTGAHVLAANPLVKEHDLHMFAGLGPKEDAYCYPNDEDDVIGEVVIVVESKTLDLYLPPGDDAILLHEDKPTRVDAAVYSDPGRSHVHYTAVARFHDLQVKDIAGLKIAWH